MVNEILIFASCSNELNAKEFLTYPIDGLILESKDKKAVTLGTMQLIQKRTTLPIFCRVQSDLVDKDYDLALKKLLVDANIFLEAGASGILFRNEEESMSIALNKLIQTKNGKAMIEENPSFEHPLAQYELFLSFQPYCILSTGYQSKPIHGMAMIQELQHYFKEHLEIAPYGNIDPNEVLAILNDSKTHILVIDEEHLKDMEDIIKALYEYSPLQAKSNQIQEDKAYDIPYFE